MCGIFAYLAATAEVAQTEYAKPEFAECVTALHPRGPDGFRERKLGTDERLYFGFHRLAINDLSEAGMQPFVEEESGTAFICNGEIYNHEALRDKYPEVAESLVSSSDCEVVYRMFLEHISHFWIMQDQYAERIKEFCDRLDAEFAFCIYDGHRRILIAARDPFGVRPLFWGRTEAGSIVFASELKGLAGLCEYAEPFPPGEVWLVNTDAPSEFVKLDYRSKRWNAFGLLETGDEAPAFEESVSCERIRRLFTDAVEKRVLVSDRPVCSLLSGGLDSSLVAAIAARVLREHGKQLETYSIGMEAGSTDLLYAQKVADHIGSRHTSIVVPEKEFLAAIPDVIRTIESYDTTSVRASVGNYLVAKYIAEHSEAKVVLNGDYSDEVCGGYLYLKNCTDPVEFDRECRRLVRDIYLFDSLRSDRSICHWGLEARTPFSDKAFIEYYMSLPATERMSAERMEKYLLRKAFDGTGLLPSEVLWRKKEAFSDGVSKPERSWHTIVAEWIAKQGQVTGDETSWPFFYPVNTPQLRETVYYRNIFEQTYGPRFANVIPYYWLPKYCGEVKDPSARVLKVYHHSESIV